MAFIQKWNTTIEYSEDKIFNLLEIDFNLYEKDLENSLLKILNSQHPTEEVNKNNRNKVKKALELLDKDKSFKALLSDENIFYFNLFKKLYLGKNTLIVKF